MAKGGPRVIGAGGGNIELLWNPYQQAFLQALDQRLDSGKRAFNRLSLFAGRRGGKTKIGGIGTVTQAGKYPNQRIWVCTGSYPKLHDYVMPAIDAVLPRSWLAKPFSASHYEWTLKNGTIINARSLDDVNRGRGPGLDLLWIDEARDVSELAWKTLVPALVDRRGAAIITTTPSGFDWCHNSFWLPASEGVPGYWACKYHSTDNPALDEEEVLAAKREMDPLFFAQEFEAEFVSFRGAIYGDSLTGQVLDTDAQMRELIPEWPKVDPGRGVLMGVDPGADHPFGAVLLVSTMKGLVAIGEYISRDAAAMRHANGLKTLLHKHHLPGADTWAIDRSQKQMSIELAQHGIFCQGAENDVVAGIQRVKSWFLGRRLWIHRPSCPKLVQQLFSYRWADNTDGSGQARRERVIKTNDDLCDALRYAIMSWPELPYPEAPSGLRDLSALPDEHRWALEREQRHDHPELFEDEDDSLDESGIAGEDEAQGVGDFWG